MTSSLVGSEMCIRDSIKGESCSTGTMFEMRTGMSRCSGNSRAAHLPWPVSYTHLTLPTICSV
eukprot:557256-Prorocentrum_lima.AAC.1